jgi:CheY-specific phosphatase CheX
MDQEILVYYARNAVEEVFGMMIGLPATAGAVYTEAAAPAEADGIITLIGLAGPWIGAGSIRCSATLACKLASSMLMEEFSAVNKDVLDAMGEITNMVFGNVKTVLEGHLGAMGLSIPTVVSGQNVSTNTPGEQVWNVIPYEVESEKMDVKICLSPNDEKSGHAGANARSRAK